MEFHCCKLRCHIALPYARLDKNNNLIRYKPIKYFKLPLREYFVLITKIEKKIMRARLFSTNIDETKITQKIVHEMKLLAEKNGSKFAFVNLYPPSESIRISGKNHLIPYNKFTTVEENVNGIILSGGPRSVSKDEDDDDGDFVFAPSAYNILSKAIRKDIKKIKKNCKCK